MVFWDDPNKNMSMGDRISLYISLIVL